MRRTYDAVIIGAGIVGLSLAYELARRRFGRIVVIDASYPGSGATGRCGEMIRSCFSSPEWIELFDDSLKRWQRLSDELDFNVLFTKRGELLLASTPDVDHKQRDAYGLHRHYGLSVELLDHNQVRELCPAIAPEMIVGGLLQTDAGNAHHDAAVWAYGAAAHRHGVEVHPYTTVTDVTVESGAVTAIHTTKGTFSTPVVVDAAGGQARDVALLAGVDVPVDTVRWEAFVTEPLEPFLRPLVSASAINGYCHQTSRGEFVGGTTPDITDYSTGVRSTLALARDMATRWLRVFPGLAGVRMMRHWSGLVTQTADSSPILCEAPGCQGFYLDCGWTYGFMGAPAAGSLMAELITTGSAPRTLAPFGIERFSSGKLVRDKSIVIVDSERSA